MADEILREEDYKKWERVNDPLYGIIDDDWIGEAFLTQSTNLAEVDRINRSWSTANLKFTDTSIGGNIAINSPPQPCRLTDPRVRNRRKNGRRITLAEDVNVGMGAWYSEKIDDNSDILFLQFGVPEFNSLITFWSRSVDYASAVIANTGRSPMAYNVGNVIGKAAVFVAFPIVSVVVYGIKALVDLVSSDRQFAYYYMKPDMVNFWKSANILATRFMLESGILAPSILSGVKGAGDAERIGVPIGIDQESIDEIKSLLPNMFTKNNNVDLAYLAGRAQSLANAQMRIEKRAFEEGTLKDKDYTGYIKTKDTTQIRTKSGSINEALNYALYLSDMPTEVTKTVNDNDRYTDSMEEKQLKDGSEAYGYMDPYVTNPTGDSKNVNETNPTNLKEEGFLANVTQWSKDFFSGSAEAFDSAVRGGGAYLALRVDHVGSLTDNIENTTTDIPAEGAVKQLSGKSKELKYSLSGGNIMFDVNKLFQAAGDFAQGAIEGITFGLSSVIPALFGGGFIDLPKMWDDSNFSQGDTSFTISLLSPSAETITKLIHEFIPLSCILAGSLPKSIGASAYTSPMLCSAFMKGKIKIDLGMITSVSITRSTANLGYDKLGRPLGADITFNITDFSNRMVVPVSQSAVGSMLSSFDDSSSINRYISTIAARDLFTNKFSVPRARLKLSNALMMSDLATSSSYFGMTTGSMMNPVLGGLMWENNLTLLHVNDANR